MTRAQLLTFFWQKIKGLPLFGKIYETGKQFSVYQPYNDL